MSYSLNGEFLLAFLENYPAAVSVFELDGTIIFANEQGCEFVKKSKSELIGRRVQEFVADTELVDRIIARTIAKGYIEDEVRIAQSNGSAVDVRLTALMVKNKDGKPLGIVGMARGASDVLGRSGDVPQVIQRILSQFPEANMLTVREVANQLRVSEETVRRWVRGGQLPSVKLPRGIRIPSEVIRDLIRVNLAQPGS